jgi:hypothetical protein
VTVDAIIPARNEALTVADAVAACRGCVYVRDVIVVDDGSTDATAAVAAAAGATVLRRESSTGSKARAMKVGVDASDAEAILFCDADLLGITSQHLEAVCRPFVDGRATMSLGTFDYGPVLNPLVLRLPPTSGERVIPRWVFEAVPEEKLIGYTIELVLNQVIADGGHRAVAQLMPGVTHRTKRDKFGLVEGYRRSWEMFWQLWGPRGVVKGRSYRRYLKQLTVLSPPPDLGSPQVHPVRAGRI